ncbi:hypothetical protein BJY00DRAFT_286546 [Aspergillus carlsbadensis]|nr:hypothetical protein BJY00DRAFT_286546 [Aspergillus carlsbadensis]
MSGRSQRILAATSTTHPPIAQRAIVKRTKALRACSACQEKRIKCIGGAPCQRCRESQTTCLINPDTDKRRKILLLRKMKALEDTIIDILEALRNEERSQRLITLVRNNASIEQIQQFVARDLSIHNPLKREKDARGSGLRDPCEMMAINYLCEAALEANISVTLVRELREL